MKRVMTLALLAFWLAAFATGQNVGGRSQQKGQGASPAQASPSPASLDFGDQAVQTMSKQLGIVLTNKTGKPIDIRDVDAGGGHWEDFEVNYDECTGVPMEAGKSCRIGVIFVPLEVGPRSAFLSITYGGQDHPQKIAVRGNGIKPNNEAGTSKDRPVSIN